MSSLLDHVRFAPARTKAFWLTAIPALIVAGVALGMSGLFSGSPTPVTGPAPSRSNAAPSISFPSTSTTVSVPATTSTTARARSTNEASRAVSGSVRRPAATSSSLAPLALRFNPVSTFFDADNGTSCTPTGTGRVGTNIALLASSVPSGAVNEVRMTFAGVNVTLTRASGFTSTMPRSATIACSALTSDGLTTSAGWSAVAVDSLGAPVGSPTSGRYTFANVD